MEAYTGFAAVYDIFMDNVPYEEWSSYLHGLLLEHGIEEGIVIGSGMWDRCDDRAAGSIRI